MLFLSKPEQEVNSGGFFFAMQGKWILKSPRNGNESLTHRLNVELCRKLTTDPGSAGVHHVNKDMSPHQFCNK